MSNRTQALGGRELTQATAAGTHITQTCLALTKLRVPHPHPRHPSLMPASEVPQATDPGRTKATIRGTHSHGHSMVIPCRAGLSTASLLGWLGPRYPVQFAWKDRRGHGLVQETQALPHSTSLYHENPFPFLNLKYWH